MNEVHILDTDDWVCGITYLPFSLPEQPYVHVCMCACQHCTLTLYANHMELLGHTAAIFHVVI